MGGSDNTGHGLASQPHRYRVSGQPLLNRHQVGGVSRSPVELFAQQEREPIRGRPAVRGKRTYGGRSPNTPTTGLRKRGNDTRNSTGRSGRQKAATRRNMRREERVTVQGPVKEQQPDGMSHRG